MTALDDQFRHLKIWAGARIPLTIDAQESILAAAVQGHFTRVQDLVREQQEAQLPYIAWLLDLEADVASDSIWEALRAKRAEQMGLPVNASLEDVLAAELKKPGCLLRIEDLRRARLGTEGMAANGPW